MFKTKLQSLGFHTPDQNLEEEKHFRNLVCWLEDQKINHYISENRKSLRNTCAGDWEQSLDKYLKDLKCPLPSSDRPLLIHWLLSYAVRLEYQRKASKVRAPQQNGPGDNPLEAMDFTSEEFKNGVQTLAKTLQIPLHHDLTVVLQAISMLIRDNLSKSAIGASSKIKANIPSIPLNKIELGFETKDLISDEAARILRLCYLKELRELQDIANEVIVACQSVTANPKTDTRLGKVGRM